MRRDLDRVRSHSCFLFQKLVLLSSIGTLLLASVACQQSSSEENDPDPERLKKLLKERPEILTETIRAHPVKFMEALQEAMESSKKTLMQRKKQKEAERLKHFYDNPLDVQLRGDEAYKGRWSAPIVLVTYSDFQCPYCRQGHRTVNALLEKYEGQMVYIYKHLPLSFHDQAIEAARFFEAIRMESRKKAMAFHDYLFKHQGRLKNGVKFLREAAQEVGAPYEKIKENLGRKKVQQRIKEDMQEAEKFGIKGTPGFVLNGVPIKGAYPAQKFIQIIEDLRDRGRLQLSF